MFIVSVVQNMASLLLPELGSMGGFNLLSSSKNWEGEINWGITSVSNKNLKRQVMGIFFSSILISSHLKFRPRLKFSGIYISQIVSSSLLKSLRAQMASLVSIFLRDSSTLILGYSVYIFVNFQYTICQQAFSIPGYSCLDISWSILTNFFLPNFQPSFSIPLLFAFSVIQKLLFLNCSKSSTKQMSLLEFLMKSLSMMRVRNSKSMRFLGSSLQMVLQISKISSSLQEFRQCLRCSLES